MRRAISLGHLLRRKWLFLALAPLLLAGVVTPVVMAQAAEVTDGLVAWYKLDAATGTTVADASGNNRAATVNGAAVFGGDQGLAFNGTDTYVKLPDNVMRGLDSISVAMDVLVDPALTGPYWLYGFGNTAADTGLGNGYLFGTGDAFRTSVSLTNYLAEQTTAPGGNLTRGVWRHVTYTQTGATGVLYQDGQVVATKTGVTIKPSDIGAGTTIANYIGKSLYRGDPLFKGRIRDFRVFNRAITATEVGQLTDDRRAGAVALDKAALTLGDTSKVTANLTLPTLGRHGSVIAWSSSNTAVVSNGGVITAPAKGKPDATVDVTATLTSRSGQQDTKMFKVTVLAELDDDSSKVNRAKDELVVRNIGDVRGNLSLPTTGSYGATITWKSDQTVISPVGVVKRPQPGAESVTVNLTATLRLNQAESSKTFTAIVPALPAPQALSGYLFSYFAGEGTANGEQVYFGLSKGNNPLQWRELNGGAPVLTSTLGEKGLRDPFIIRSPEGDKFYQIATDLKINGAVGDAWGRSQTTGSKSIMVWESTDLVNWTNQRLVKVSPDTAGNTWAPEAYYDSSLGAYVVFWASKLYAVDDPNHTVGTYNRMMYATTRDFHTFSEPKVWVDPGYSVIDSTVIEHEGTYHRFTKDERDNTSSSACSKFIIQQKATSLLNLKYDFVADCIGKGAMSQGEGPLVFKSNTENKWYLFVDEYGGRGYIPFETTDLASGKWRPSTNYALPSRPRHGTVLPVTQAEYDRLLKAYGQLKPAKSADDVAVVTRAGHAPALPATVTARYADGTTGAEIVSWDAVPASAYASAGEFTVNGALTDQPTIKVKAKVQVRAQADLLLHYKFDETSGTVAKDSSGQGNDGKYERTPAFGTGVRGGSFKMSGGANNSATAPYVTIPNGLLGGVDSVTVSAFVKADSAAINQWIFGLGPDNQKYLFATPYNRDRNTRAAVTVGSNPTEDAAVTSGLPVGKWKHLAVVLDSKAKTLVLYIDGVEVARDTNVSVKAADLYDSSKGFSGYIGKSLYPDPYFGGEVDDFRVYARALPAGDVFDLAESTGIMTVTLDDLKVPAIVSNDISLIVLPIKPASGLTQLAPTFRLTPGATITPAQGTVRDFTKPVTYTVTGADGKERVWTVDAKIMNSPLLPGKYADPNIAVFDNKFWIYPTTDGFDGWSGTQFKAFSSTDLVTWKDHGVILDLGPDVTWADDSAWAPTIARGKNGKYYFYFSGGPAGGEKSLGVATATKPEGPFTDSGQALVPADAYPGQMIDSAVFTDDDGTSYLYWGNGNSYQVPLNDDMVSFDRTRVMTYKPTNYNEGTFVFKRNGTYYFTWSENDTRSEDYRVAYATGTSPLGPWSERKGVILSKDLTLGIKGPGHHSVVQVPGTDDWYIAYHRFAMPGGNGFNRETTIDRLEFHADGAIKKVIPTLESVQPINTVDAGPDVTGVEGAAISLDGRTPGDTAGTWTYAATAGVDAGATCSFADANAVRTTITCTDDGAYTVTLTSGAVSDTATVTVTNAAPKIEETTSPTSASVGEKITVTARLSDPGRHDTLTCSVDWKDGATSTGTTENGICSATHTYTAAGTYRPQITVTDDDGAVDSQSVKADVTVRSSGSSPGASAAASPSVSASPSATASASASASASPSASAAPVGVRKGGLPTTGVQIAIFGGLGLLLAGAGAVLLLIGRRRRTVDLPGDAM